MDEEFLVNQDNHSVRKPINLCHRIYLRISTMTLSHKCFASSIPTVKSIFKKMMLKEDDPLANQAELHAQIW